MQRMRDGQEEFTKNNRIKNIEEDYAGIFWLLRVAKDPSYDIIEEAAE
jgi:hypothetical protein